MEGKALLFKHFGGIDAVPICLDVTDVDELVETDRPARPGVRRHQPRGHQRAALLRGRAPAAGAARHPGLPRRPARHRDRRAGGAAQRRPADRAQPRRPAAWSAAAPAPPASRSRRMLLDAGVGDLAIADRQGVVHVGREDLNDVQARVRRGQQPGRAHRARFVEALAGADVLLGLSGGTVPRRGGGLDGPASRSCSRWPTRCRRCCPDVAHAAGARVVATGRSDFPNQINNVLAFPGVFKGAMQVRATRITEGMKLAAADALAGGRRRRPGRGTASSRRCSTRGWPRPSPGAVARGRAGRGRRAR